MERISRKEREGCTAKEQEYASAVKWTGGN